MKCASIAGMGIDKSLELIDRPRGGLQDVLGNASRSRGLEEALERLRAGNRRPLGYGIRGRPQLVDLPCERRANSKGSLKIGRAANRPGTRNGLHHRGYRSPELLEDGTYLVLKTGVRLREFLTFGQGLLTISLPSYPCKTLVDATRPGMNCACIDS